MSDASTYLAAFLCGGILCLIGQILIDKTKLTPARILVLTWWWVSSWAPQDCTDIW